MTDEELNELFARVLAAGPDRDTLILIAELHQRLSVALRPYTYADVPKVQGDDEGKFGTKPGWL